MNWCLYFFQGLSIGLAYVAPIGLQNLFVINTALTESKKRVFLSAVIVVFFDISLAISCFYGIGAIISLSKWIELSVLFIGSIIVSWIGISTIRSKISIENKSEQKKFSIPKIIINACVVTWFNPQALIDGSMMMGAFKASLPIENNINFILGVCTASIIWFFGISAIISFFKAKFTNKILKIINIICGIVIITYGIILLVNFIKKIIVL